MSQKSSQSSIPYEESFSNETCKSFLMKFSEENDHYKKAKILHSFILPYLLHYRREPDFESNSDIVIEVLSKVSSLCKMFLTTTCMSSYWNDSTEKVTDKAQNIECACLCFDIIQKSLETFSCMKQSISITKIALNILFLGYSHCKDSEIIYGDQLEQFVNQLGSFFKKIESLQMIVLQKLHELNITKDSESYIIDVMQEIGNLCQVVSSIDADVAFDLWTMYIKLVSNHSYVKQNFSSNTLIAYIALKNLEILQQSKLSLDKNTEEDEELGTLFAFYLDALLNLLNLDTSNHKENILQFRILLINFFDFLALCFSLFIIEKNSLNMIRNSLTKTTYPLIWKLYSNEEFLISALNLNDSDQISNSEAKQLPTGLLLLNLCSLQFMECASVQQKKQIFHIILSCLITGGSEMDDILLYRRLPLCAVTKTDSDELVTLYQFAFEQISMLLKSLPDLVIQTLNDTELVWLTETSDVVFLLISDVWTYRLRCSSIKFFKNQCHFILEKCLRYNTCQKPQIKSFLKRLLKFLPKPDKEMLYNEFSTLKIFLDENETIYHRYGTPNFFSSEYEFQSSAESIMNKVSKLSKDHTDDIPQLIQRACSCLELCTSFIKIAGSAEILQFIEFAIQMFKSDVYEVQIAVLTLIKALSKRYVPEHTSEFGKILSCMAQLFSQAIHSKNYIVQNEALHTFGCFAKCTPHIRIVQETVRQDPSLKPLIKSYIAAVPENGFLTERGKNEYIKKLLSIHTEEELKISESSKLSLQKIFSR